MSSATAILRAQTRLRIAGSFLLTFALLWALLLPLAAFAGGPSSALASLCSNADFAAGETETAAPEADCFLCAVGAVTAAALPSDADVSRIAWPMPAQTACACVLAQSPKPSDSGLRKDARGPPARA